MADTVAELADVLAEVRRRREITQAVVGAALGLTKVSIANWEGGRVPSTGNFVLWADALSQRLVVVGADGGVLSTSRPIPAMRGEEVYQYRVRCLALTLRDVRLSGDLGQATVGARLGVSKWTVSMWENARRLPRLPRLLEWCGVLGCRLELRGR